MNRSLWIGIAATFLLFIMLIGYFYTRYIKPDDKPLYAVIPETAVAVAFTSNAGESMEILKETKLWQLLQSYPSSAEAIQVINLYDSILQTTLLKDGEIAVSLHVQGAQPEWMITMHMPKDANLNDVLAAINYHNKYRIKPRTYEGVKLYDLQDAAGSYRGVFAATNAYVFFTTSGLLAESAVRKLKFKVSAQTDEISMLQPFEDKSTPFRLYVNYRQLGKLYACISDILTDATWISPLQNLANWSMLNVSVQQNELVFKGISLTDDTVSQFLDLFRNQNPVLLDDINRFVPSDCAYFTRMGFSDYLTFKNELDDYHYRLGLFLGYKSTQDSISTLYKVELNNFTAVIGNQALLGSVQYAGQQNIFALIKTNSAEGAAQLLDNYRKQLDKRMLFDSLHSTQEYKGFILSHWPFGNFLSQYFGSLYNGISNPCVVLVEDVLIMAHNHEVLKHILDAHQTRKVLSTDELYAKMKSLSGPTSNLDLYINTPQSFAIPLAYVNASMHSHLNRNEGLYKKFSALHFQFASTNDRYFYTQYAIQLQPEFEEKKRLLWQVKLDTTPLSPPVMVFNRNEQVYDIMIQDIQNVLYCIAADGIIKWKTKMSGPVVSTIHSVTYHPSGKWGYLFNTSKSVSLIDPNGKNVSGFPIYLPGIATSGLLLTDFYNDSSYQFFIPLSNKRVMGYAISGKALPSWNPKVTPDKLVNLKYGIVYNQPVVYASTDSKKLYIWKPDGAAVQHGFTNGADFLISDNKMLVIDTLSKTVLRFTLDENMNPIQSSAVVHSDSSSFMFLNKQILGTESIGLTAYDLNGQYLLGPVNRVYVYTQLTAANDYMIFDSLNQKMISYTGSVTDDGFPADASAPGTLGILMNDGVRYLVVPGTANYLNAFRLK